MKSYKDRGLILKVRKIKDNDRMVVIFTENNGKVNAIAKGANKILSSKSSTLDLLNFAEFSFYKTNSEFDLITEVTLLNDFAPIKSTLEQASELFYLAELLDKFLYAQESSEQLFKDTISLLENYEQFGRKKSLLLIAFQLKLLEHFGYSPQLDSCLICGDEFKAGGLRIGSQESTAGYLCEKHFLANDYQTYAYDTIIKLQRYILQHNLENLAIISMTSKLLKDTYNIQQEWIQNLLERKVTSSEFMEQFNFI